MICCVVCGWGGGEEGSVVQTFQKFLFGNSVVGLRVGDVGLGM